MTSSVDPDSCISSSIKDFVFDLHDSVRNAQIPSEQLTLYNGTFRELAAKVRYCSTCLFFAGCCVCTCLKIVTFVEIIVTTTKLSFFPYVFPSTMLPSVQHLTCIQ